MDSHATEGSSANPSAPPHAIAPIAVAPSTARHGQRAETAVKAATPAMPTTIATARRHVTSNFHAPNNGIAPRYRFPVAWCSTARPQRRAATSTTAHANSTTIVDRRVEGGPADDSEGARDGRVAAAVTVTPAVAIAR